MKVFAAGVFFLLPFGAYAGVSISEIAWVGTAVSANDEWLELANDGSAAVDVTGWILETEDGGISAALTGSIPANGFYLLERTSDETLSGIAANVIYTGALRNSGEILLLKNAPNSIVERLDFSAGWSAGDNATKDTMQKIGGAWVTGVPTPKAANSGNATPNTDSDSGTQPGAGSGSSGSASSSGSSSPSPESTSSNNTSSSGDLKVSFTVDTAQIPAESGTYFRARASQSGKNADGGTSFTWSFGDGTTAQGIEVWHSYRHEGTYVVVLKAASGGAAALARMNVSVFAPNILLTFENSQGAPVIGVTNNSLSEVNLTHFRIRADGWEFAFPDDTILAAKRKIMLGSEITGLPLSQLAAKGIIPELVFPSGETAVRAQTSQTEVVASSTNFSSSSATASTSLHMMSETLAQVFNQASQLNTKITAFTRMNTRTAVIARSSSEKTTAHPKKVEKEISTNLALSETSGTASVVVVEKPRNIFSRIWSWMFGE